MRKFSEPQKWVVYWMSDGYQLHRIGDYVFVRKHPFENRVSLSTFRAMFDRGLIELRHEFEPDRREFCLTKRAADLLKAGELSPRMSYQNKKVLPAVSR